MFLKVMKKVVCFLLIVLMTALSIIPIWAVNDMDGYDKKTEVNNSNKIKLDNDLMEIVTYPNSIIQDSEVQKIINDSSRGIEDLADAILLHNSYTEGLINKYEIANIESFKTALKLKYPEISDWELGKTILLSLGDSEDFIDTLPEEKVIEAIGYSYVEKSKSFYKETPSGETIALSEDEYYNEVANISIRDNTYNENNNSIYESEGRSTATSSPVYDKIDPKENGYLIITSTAYKTNPSYAESGRNYFTIRGEIEWTNSPSVMGRDVLAIGSSGNVDNHYTPYACAYWPYYDTEGIYDYAYLNQNNGQGTIGFGDAFKIDNPSIYGIDAEFLLDLPGDMPILKSVYAYYGISTQSDVTCQVAYAHRTMNLGDLSVSIDIGGNISFSAIIEGTYNEYYGESFTLYHESYALALNSPINNMVVDCNSNPPSFLWSVLNGLPNNYYIEFDYLNNGNYMSRFISGANSYTLSQADWNTIKNSSPFLANGTKQVKWRIRINYSIYPNETPYYTDWKAFIITGFDTTTEEILPLITAGNRYTEKLLYLGTGGYKDITITFATSGNRVIQTFGTMDTVLELYSSNRTLLLGQSDTDDNGYASNALISYNFTANTSYIIRVKFYSPTAYGSTKLAIVPTYHHNNYESAYGIYGETTVNWNLGTNAVALFRYQFTSRGTATFRMSSNVDTYLYIIDPTTTTPIVQFSATNMDCDNLYDDDTYGNLQALLSKKVQAGKEYLVIISFFNPSTMSGDFSITSSFVSDFVVEELK